MADFDVSAIGGDIDSFASKISNGATVKTDSISGAGTIIDVSGERGVASLYTTGTSSASNEVTITVDGISFSGVFGGLGRILNPIPTDPSSLGVAGLSNINYRNSIKVEVTSYISSTTISVTRLS